MFPENVHYIVVSHSWSTRNRHCRVYHALTGLFTGVDDIVPHAVPHVEIEDVPGLVLGTENASLVILD